MADKHCTLNCVICETPFNVTLNPSGKLRKNHAVTCSEDCRYTHYLDRKGIPRPKTKKKDKPPAPYVPAIDTINGFCGVSGCDSKHKTTKGYCPKHYSQMRKFGAIQPDIIKMEKDCAWCGSKILLLPSKISQRACSHSCASKLKAKEAGQWIKEHNEFDCVECGSKFTRNKKNLHNGEALYCSSDCYHVALNRRSAELEEKTQLERLVNKEINLLNRIGRKLRLKFEKINCKHCQKEILKSERVVWLFCSEYCHKESRRITLRKHRSIRDARIRGASRYESFDPFYVFERDKWTCKCCGIKTPRKLRGTNHPDAPELDHIVPISLGGTHTKDNTQLLCKSCNSSKSNKHANDQMLLFG